MRKNFLFSFLLLSWILLSKQIVVGQEWSTVDRNRYEIILKPTADFLASEVFTYRVKYTSFIGHTGTRPVEEMKGLYTRNKESFYCNMPGNFSLQKGDVRVQIDTLEKIVVLLPAEKEMNHKSWEWAYEKMLSQTAAIQESEIDGKVVIRFTFKKGNELEEQWFYLREDGLLDRIVMFYSAELPIDPKNEKGAKEKARLEIKFYQWEKVASLPNSWDLDQIISVSKKDIKLLGRFQKYELVEFR